MKIALVKRRCSLRVGGSERYCVNLARQFRSLGHEVCVVGESIDDDLNEEIEFHRVPVVSWTSSTKNRSFAIGAGRIAQRLNCDIVYGLGRAHGLDVVRVTERLQSHWLGVRYRHPLQRRLQRWNPRHRTLIDLERRIYTAETTRRIVVQSQLDRTLVMHWYGVDPSRIRVIPNGVDLGHFTPMEETQRQQFRQRLVGDANCPLFIFASMDFEGKGLLTVLRSLALLEDRKARLLVLGDGPIARFRRIAHRLGIAEQVIFLGRRSDIQRFYSAGDLFVLPTAYEPFPNVNLEAMACGLPVLTTRTAGGVDIVEENVNGYLIADYDAGQEMVDAFRRHLALSEEARRGMGQNCISTARDLPIQRNVESTLELFHEVLHAKRAA